MTLRQMRTVQIAQQPSDSTVQFLVWFLTRPLLRHVRCHGVVSGSLFGVWISSEENMIIGSFWKLTSGNCFRIQCFAWYDSGYMFICQYMEAVGVGKNFAGFSYVKVDTGSGSHLSDVCVA